MPRIIKSHDHPYTLISKAEANARGLTGDCVRQHDGIAFHARTGLCWHLTPPSMDQVRDRVKDAIAALNAAATAMEDFRDYGEIAEFVLENICREATADAEWLSTIAAQLDDQFIYDA